MPLEEEIPSLVNIPIIPVQAPVTTEFTAKHVLSHKRQILMSSMPLWLFWFILEMDFRSEKNKHVLFTYPHSNLATQVLFQVRYDEKNAHFWIPICN